MAKKPPVHILPRGNGWAVVREGNDRATSVHQTQKEAAEEGRDLARRHETEFLLHGKDGQIRGHNDFGRGRRPPEGASTGRATQDFAPGTRMLGEPTNEEGQTLQRTTDEQGNIVETAFDEEGNVVREDPVGGVADLPAAEGYEETTDEEGITKRVVTDESGTLIEVQIGPDGSVLDLQIPPSIEKVEETTEQAGEAAQGTQEDMEAQAAQDATQQAAGRKQADQAAGADQQASETAQEATEQASQAAQDATGQQAGDAAGRKTASGGQDTEEPDAERQDAERQGTVEQTNQQDGEDRQDEAQAGGQEPNATPAARRKAEEMGVDLSRVEGSGARGRIIVDDVRDPSGSAKGGTAGEQRAVGRAEQAAQGARGTAGQTSEEAGEATRRTAGAEWSAGSSRRAATDGATAGARDGGTLEGRPGDAEEVRGVTERERDDRFETIGKWYANYEVYDRDGERLGIVDHLFLDREDEPEYVGVETGLSGSRAVLIPAEAIVVEDERRRMVVSQPKSLVESGPSFEDQEEVTPGFEERVRSHYGLPSRPVTEDRSGHDALLTEGRTERVHGVSGAAGSGTRLGGTESGELREHGRKVEGVSQPGSDLEDELRIRRSEEELRVGTREHEAGTVNVRTRVRTDRERMEVPTRREEVRVDRVPVEGETSGTEIGDDEVRVPVTEEEVVVEKRPVVREEIRLRKEIVEDTKVVEEDVRREEVEVDEEPTRRDRPTR